MIYGNRFYAFNQPVKEAVEEVAAVESTLTFESALEGFDTVMALSKTNSEILESYCDLLENAIVTVEEGANQEYTDAFANGFSEFKENFKAGKKAFKAKEYKDAKKKFEEAEKAADKIIKGIKKVNSDGLGSWFVGNVIAGAIGSIIGCLIVAISMIPVVGQVLGGAVTLALDVEAVHSTINWLKAMLKDKENLAKAWNGYKNELETAAKFLKQISQLSAKSCDTKLKAKEDK